MKNLKKILKKWQYELTNFDRIIILSSIFISFNVIIFGKPSNDTFINFLIAIGSMTAGMVAIVFTISTFLIQNASEIYSSQYFDTYVNDKKDKYYYIALILIIMSFFGLSLSLKKDNNTFWVLILFSFALLGIVFILIYKQFNSVLEKINPLKAISTLEKIGISLLEKNYFDNKENINICIENLVQISIKLALKNEIISSKQAVNSICNIFIKLIELKVFHTNYLDILDRLLKRFMKDGNDELSSHFFKIYFELVSHAVKNQHSDFYIIFSYSFIPIEKAIQSDNLETVYQGVKYLKQNAELSVQSLPKKDNKIKNFNYLEKLDFYMQHIINENIEIALYAYQKNKSFILDICSEIYCLILKNLISHDYDNINKYFDEINKYCDALKFLSPPQATEYYGIFPYGNGLSL